MNITKKEAPAFVVDNSVTMAWFFEDEAVPYAERVEDALKTHEAFVPSLWHIEAVNAMLMGQRRKRTFTGKIIQFMEILHSLPIHTDEQTTSRAFNTIFTLALEFGLTAYDAAYLELALRRGLPLATLDKELIKAAKEAGVKIFAP